jgi:predicted nucleic acid-binding protein
LSILEQAVSIPPIDAQATLERARKVRERFVPPLWQSEFRNVLAAYIRRGMKLAEAKQIMQDALETLEKRQIIPPYEKVLDLVMESDCTAYGCEFVVLAKELGVQLVSADRQLLKQFSDWAISLEEFSK